MKRSLKVILVYCSRQSDLLAGPSFRQSNFPERRRRVRHLRSTCDSGMLLYHNGSGVQMSMVSTDSCGHEMRRLLRHRVLLRSLAVSKRQRPLSAVSLTSQPYRGDEPIQSSLSSLFAASHSRFTYVETRLLSLSETCFRPSSIPEHQVPLRRRYSLQSMRSHSKTVCDNSVFHPSLSFSSTRRLVQSALVVLVAPVRPKSASWAPFQHRGPVASPSCMLS